MVPLLFLLASQLPATTPVVVKEIKSEWQVYVNGSYQPYSDGVVATTVYFTMTPSRLGGHHLYVRAPDKWQLFVNGNLIYSGKEAAYFSMDSLQTDMGSPVLFGVHVKEGMRDVLTQLVLLGDTRPGHQVVASLRPPTFFRDYGIIVAVFLLLFFLLLYRTNPQLTVDYFSFSKIFSASERNETQLASRITSSANLLFYLFCALLTGFLLSAIFYSSGPFFRAASSIRINSMASAFEVWGKLSVFILTLLASKLLIVTLFSALFNFRETISFQFFNFLRFVLFTAVTMAVLSLLFFTIRVDAAVFYERLIVLGLVLLSIGSLVVLFKLLGKARFSFFHLFSYLCVSEFIPLVIIIKIFF